MGMEELLSWVSTGFYMGRVGEGTGSSSSILPGGITRKLPGVFERRLGGVGGQPVVCEDVRSIKDS